MNRIRRTTLIIFGVFCAITSAIAAHTLAAQSMTLAAFAIAGGLALGVWAVTTGCGQRTPDPGQDQAAVVTVDTFAGQEARR